jgi:hypothetical protein
MKNFSWILALLAIVWGIFLFFQNSSFKSRLEMSEHALDQQKDSIEFFRLRSMGDSLLIEGETEKASEYYNKANQVFGVQLIPDAQLRFGNFNFHNDSLQNLRQIMISALKEVETLKLSSFRDALSKDSLLSEKDLAIAGLNQTVLILKDSLVEVQRNLVLKGSIGKLEFQTLNGTKVLYAGDIKNGKANGAGYGLLSTGGVYEGEWKENKRHGKGKYTWKDGSVYEGDYYNDERQGKGTYHFVSGEKYIGEWKHNKRNGKGILYAKDGKEVVNGLWENDEPVKKADVN